MTTLDAVFAHLLRRAKATGKTQSATLKGGARLVVLVQGARMTVTVGRANKDVGTVEELTFYRLCHVPEHARRLPERGQAQRTVDDVTWHILGWTWDADAG